MGFDFYQRDALGRTNRRDLDAARYFRVSVHGMPLLVGLMRATGVLDATAEAPALPLRDPAQPADVWLRATEGLRAFRARDIRRVPLVKFGSNDAWVVTPSECEAIAGALGAALRGVEDRLRARPVSSEAREQVKARIHLVQDWASFQRRCARAGGYEVW